MKLLSFLSLLLLLCLFQTVSPNQLNADKRIFCFTFIYFQSGPLFKQYLSPQPPKEQRKQELQKELVDQVEMCEELIQDIKTDEGLKGVYDDQEKLVEIIKGLRKVKQELEISSGKGGVSLSERQQQIVRDFQGYSVMFEEIQGKKGGEEEGKQKQNGGENAQEVQL